MKINIVIFINQKGGVAKTTNAREIGIALNLRGHRVLMIDTDPQGNLTKSLVDGAWETGLYEAFEGEPYEIMKIQRRLSVIGGDARLSGLEKRYLGEVDAYERLRNIVETLVASNEFDLVLIDSPPSLSVLTLNGLAAATHFIIPVRPTLYSLQGTNDLLNSVAKVRKSLNPGLELLGVIINEYNNQPLITRQIREEIESVFGGRVFQTVLSRTVKIEEAIAQKIGVVELDEGSKIAAEIRSLADEFTARLGLSPGGGA